MRILVGGDSWTKGWGLDFEMGQAPWPSYLDGNNEVKNVSQSGDSNSIICQEIKSAYHKNKPDLIIVGWTSVLRCGTKRGNIGNPWELSDPGTEWLANKYQRSTIDDLRSQWFDYLNQIESLPCNVIHFTVFGDELPPVKNKIDKSYLEYLANDSGYNFLYPIPTFEFGLLQKESVKSMEILFQNSGVEDYKLACFERDKIQLDFTSPNFQICGHPTHIGHMKWGEEVNRAIRSL